MEELQRHHSRNDIFMDEEDEQLACPALVPATRPRHNWCVKIASSPWLEHVSILMVILNCVSLGTYKPCEEKTGNLEILDYLVFAYFMVEMLVKRMALGHTGYFRNNWNKFDFLIITAQIFEYCIAGLGLHLEVCHVLKPMRLINRVSSMQEWFSVLLNIMPMFGNVLILYMFVIHIFGIVGVQLWAGEMRNRCFLGDDIPEKYNVSLNPFFVFMAAENPHFICSPDNENGMRYCRDVPPYREDGKTCSLAAPHHGAAANKSVPAVVDANTTCVNWNLYYNVCRKGDHNPGKGAINFDNIGYAWITLFQVVTLEGWSNIMYYVMDAYSFWSFVFFIVLTIIGSSIIMNVSTVVIAVFFSDTVERKTGEHCAGTWSVRMLLHKLTRSVSTLLWSIVNRRCNRVYPGGSWVERRSTLAGIWSPIQQKFKKIVESKLFNRTLGLAVLLSTIAMAIEHHEQPQELTLALQISNRIFTFIFVVEMFLKLSALSWVYFTDRDNIFDFVIVIMSLWELSSSKLSVIRAFRVLRFLKLVHFLPCLRRQLLVLKRAMKGAATLCWLMLFVTFIFSLMGMHLFGCKFTTKPRANFDTLLWSMVTVFQILTLEDWNLVLYNAIDSTSAWAALYFVAVIMFGRNVLLNILVGIVVDSFQESQPSTLPSSGTASSAPAILTPENGSRRTTENCSVSAPEPSMSNGTNSSSEEDAAKTDTNEDNGCLTISQKVLRWCKEHEDWSMYIFSPGNRCRIFCQRVISHKAFDLVILVFILMSCITIAMERPGIDPKSTERSVLKTFYFLFTAIFLVEMLVKVLALGLLFGKGSYCCSYWNVMDGLLVILSLVNLFVTMVTAGQNNLLGILKVLRLLRIIRPLRVIKRIPKLKLAMEALIASFKPMGNIVVICSTFFFFFGILGVQLLKGKFHYCVGQNTKGITNKADCLLANHRWLRKEYNFDNLPQALMSLFVMYSVDGWVNIMYDGLDAVGVDKQPVRNHNPWMLLFFISFIVVSILLLDMFIGVMVETFHQCQLEQRREDEGLGGIAIQVQEQVRVPYYTHYSCLRRKIHTLCTSKFLDLFMTVMIFVSVFTMAFEHYKQPKYLESLIDYSYYVFTVMMIIELLLKIVAFGVVRFLKVSWNLLDVGIVVASIISIFFSTMEVTDETPINLSILRVCRGLKLVQVLKAKKIRVLLKTTMKTLSQVGNIGLLFMLFFFIFAAIGVELFGKLKCTANIPCQGLNQHANFSHFGMALLTLYRVCTGDDWNGILKDILRTCHPDHSGCSYLYWIAPLYFVSFVVMAQFGLANLVVAVVMQALEDSRKEELPDTEEDLLSTGLPSTSRSSRDNADSTSE